MVIVFILGSRWWSELYSVAQAEYVGYSMVNVILYLEHSVTAVEYCNNLEER
jgi:hypothetical protein